MKYASMTNTLTFCIISAVTAYALVNLAMREQQSTEQVRVKLEKLRHEHADFSQEILTFAHSELFSHDELSSSSEVVKAAAHELAKLVESQAELNPRYYAPCFDVVEHALDYADRAEHIRSQVTVLRNGLKQVDQRLRDLNLSATESPLLINAISDTRPAIPKVPTPNNVELYDLLDQLSEEITQSLSKVDADQAVQLRIVRAQIGKVVATSRFLDSDFEKVDPSQLAGEIEDVLALVEEISRENAAAKQGMLRLLSVSSVSLVAFVAVGIWQFRSQAIELACLNKELETRVKDRTQQLASSQEFLAMILDSLPSHICILNAVGEIIQTNAMWNRFPLADESMYRGIGTSYYDICEKSSGPSVAVLHELAEEIKRIIEGKSSTYSAEYCSELGEHQRWFQVTVTPVTGNSAGNVVVSHTCITERVRVELALQRQKEEAEEQRALLNAVMGSVGDGIIAADEHGHFLCFNRAAEQILEKEVPESTRLDDWAEEYQLFELDGTTRVGNEAVPMFRAIQGETFSNQEFLVRRATGDATISVNAAPLRSGTYQGGVITLRDVTDHKQLEQQLSQAQKLESIGQLAAGIAHEINTPMQFVGDNLEFLNECAEKLLTVVDRYRELLEGEQPRSWEERREEIREVSEKYRFEFMRAQFPEAIEECLEGIHRTVKIVKAMKDFSHPGNKERTDVDINQAIESTVAISRNRWKYSAEMHLELDPNLPLVPVYAAEINQVFLNLVVNAADAIAEHYSEGDLGAITVRTFQLADAVQIDIEDNGCGIPEEIIAKVFDPFFTTKEVGKGTGQGLSITNSVVVNMHQGSIGVQSTVGQGTVFSIRLPLEPQATDAENEAVECTTSPADAVSP